MAAIIWDDRVLGTGIESIDDQHRRLVSMINDLLGATAAGRGKDEICRMMDFLAQYTIEHFAHEERVMAEHNCPAAAANRAAHEEFTRDFEALRLRFESEGPTLAFVLEVQKRVVNWLTHHIQGCDLQLRKCALRT